MKTRKLGKYYPLISLAIASLPQHLHAQITFTELTDAQNPLFGFDLGDESAPTFVDIDGDGDLDLVSGEKNGTFEVYLNDGSNSFTNATNAQNPLSGFNVGVSYNGYSSPTFVDIDGDSDLDMVSGTKDGKFKVYLNGGSNNFTAATELQNPLSEFDPGNNSTPTFVDLDGDSDLDMVSGKYAGAFEVYLNDGSNNFAAATGTDNHLSGFDVGTYSSPTFVDIDGDGDLDMVSGTNDGKFKVYLNSSNNFTAATAAQNPLSEFSIGNRTTPTFVDIDGDGDLDLVSGTGDGKFKIFVQNTSVLPLKLVSFEAQKNVQNDVVIYWETASESNMEYFEIQRSSDGTHFEAVGQVDATNQSTTTHYQFLDTVPTNGRYYYRLAMVEPGIIDYSSIDEVIIGQVELSIFPNPASDQLTIQGVQTGNYSIYNRLGVLVANGKVNQVINVSDLQPGYYYIEIKSEKGKVVKNFIKQ